MSHNRKLRKTGVDKARKYVDKYVPTGKWTVLSFSDMMYMKQQYQSLIHTLAGLWKESERYWQIKKICNST